LAHHYTEAALTLQAIRYWRRAGQRAIDRSAHMEAIAHLTKGLELLKALPNTPERAQQELRLQVTLGPALMAAKGYGVPEVEYAYARARELCQQVGETPLLFPTLGGLCAFYLERAEVQTAHELAEQLLRLAQRVQEPVLLVWAHRALGATFLFLGEFVLAREHFEQSLALYDPQKHHAYGFVYDPGVTSLSMFWPLFCSGLAIQTRP